MNVQNHIIKGIKELLYSNNYLVIPNFGGFVLKQSSSHFSNSTGILNPPSKIVSFNKQLKQNDGVLVMWLQNQLKCTTDQSLKHLNDFSDYFTSVLSARRRLSIDNIGFFYLDFENNILFEPQPDTNFLTNSFGLSSISLIPLPILLDNKNKNDFNDRSHVKSKNTFLNRQKYQKVIFSILIFGLLFFALSLFVSSRKFSGNFQANIFSSSYKPIYQTTTYPELVLASNHSNKNYIANSKGVAMLSLGNNNLFSVNTLEPSLDKLKPVETIKNTNYSKNNSANFNIILGCFVILKNAEGLVNKLNQKNIPASILEIKNRGMHIVTYNGFNSIEEANLKLKEVKKDFPTAWIKSR